jgi:hypothetical protein
LVVAIDASFNARDLTIAHIWTARNVLFVPQQVIEAALPADEAEKSLIRIVDILPVPADDHVAVKRDDDSSVDHEASFLQSD